MSDPRSAFKKARSRMTPELSLGEPHGGPLWCVVEATQHMPGGGVQRVECLAYCDPLRGQPIAPELLEGPLARGPVAAVWPLPMLDALRWTDREGNVLRWENLAGLSLLKPRILIPRA